MSADALTPRPAADVPPYAVPRAGAPTDLRLDANEGPALDPALLDALPDAASLRSYPSAADLETRLAGLLAVAPEGVLVTAGADDALDRAFRALVRPGDEVVMPTPGFSATLRWIALADARHVDVAWPDGPYPTEAVMAALTPRTRVVVVTSPNNPTGGIVAAADLARLAAAAPQALLLVDLAYTEFADEDLTQAALALPNALVTRTFSKAWGLAGLRVGYAAGAPRVVRWLRAAGLPYAVSAPSLALAARALDDPTPMEAFASRVREERVAMAAALRQAGARPQDSQANFLLARVEDPLWWRDGLAGLGIAIRAFPGTPRLEDAVRIGCPGDPADLARLEAALRTLSRPERLVVEGAGLGLPGEIAVDDVGSAIDHRPSWVVARTEAGVAAARARRALPLALEAPALVPRGAARSLDADGVARRWAAAIGRPPRTGSGPGSRP